MISCTFEDGGKTSLRHITIGAIVENKNNQVLLVKRAANLINGGKYAIPGGFLNRDEDTRKGVLRELKEETGIDGEIISLFRVNDGPNRPKEDRQNVDIIYLVSPKNDTLELSRETTSVAWFSEDKLPSEENFAFDHRQNIEYYFEYKKKGFSIPIIGSML